MSHTTTIKDIIFTDTQALKDAITYLKNNGVDCDLLENAVPRSYSSRQSGMSEKAPLVLRLNKGKYDVGFYPSEGKSGYEARTDFYTGAVEAALGVQIKENGVSEAQRSMGKLYQAYSVCATKNQAIAQGYAVSESRDAEGNVKLHIYA